jgi:NADPH:quinone reductase-like Zn-dependent oxidoreductase
MVYTRYGLPDVLELREVETPAPKDNEILVRVRATSVNYGDLVARNFRSVSPGTFNMPLPLWFFARVHFGFWRPKTTVLGSEFAGEVLSVGKAVTRFKQGDEVFGHRGPDMGAYAEYLCLAEDGCVAKKPANMTLEEAGTVPYGAIMALNLLQKASIQPRQKVLILGASGAIGSAALQLAKFHFGAEVTGVCSTPRVALVKSLGADRVIDYTREDFTQTGEAYDLIFDVLGRGSIRRCRRVLKPTGMHLCASFKMKQLLYMLLTSRSRGKRLVCAMAPGSLEDLLAVRELIEAGKLRSIIDRCYPLEQLAEAHRYVEQGHRQADMLHLRS